MYLLDLMKQYFYVITVTISLYIASASLFATITIFTISILYVGQRNRFLNLILTQLVFDEPIDDQYHFININSDILTQEFVNVNSQWNVNADNSKKDASNTFWHVIENILVFKRQTIDTSATGYGKRMSEHPNKIWSIHQDNLDTHRQQSDCRNCETLIENIISSYTLRNIGILNRM